MSDIICDHKGNMSAAYPANKQYYTLRELREIVGGEVELYDLGKYWLAVNSRGKILRLPNNYHATLWASEATDEEVYGTALLFSKNKVDPSYLKKQSN